MQERFEGILQAIDTLAAEEQQSHSPDEASASAGQSAAREEGAKGRGEEGGEGELTREALSTMQPGDIMPRPVREMHGLGRLAGVWAGFRKQMMLLGGIDLHWSYVVLHMPGRHQHIRKRHRRRGPWAMETQECLV